MPTGRAYQRHIRRNERGAITSRRSPVYDGAEALEAAKSLTERLEVYHPMTHLSDVIQQSVSAWRKDSCPTDDYPALAETLDYAVLAESGNLRSAGG